MYLFNGNEDWVKYDASGIDTVNVRYSETNELIFTAVAAHRWNCATMFQTDSDWVIEFSMRATGNDGGRIGFHSTELNNPERKCVGFKTQSNSLKIETSPNSSSAPSTSIGSYNSYLNMRIEATQSDNTIKVYVNDVLKKTQISNDWLKDTIAFYLNGWATGNVIYVKNVIAKKLTSST